MTSFKFAALFFPVYLRRSVCTAWRWVYSDRSSNVWRGTDCFPSGHEPSDANSDWKRPKPTAIKQITVLSTMMLSRCNHEQPPPSKQSPIMVSPLRPTSNLRYSSTLLYSSLCNEIWLYWFFRWHIFLFRFLHNYFFCFRWSTKINNDNN